MNTNQTFEVFTNEFALGMLVTFLIAYIVGVARRLAFEKRIRKLLDDLEDLDNDN